MARVIGKNRASVLIVVLVFVFVAAAFCMATAVMSTADSHHAAVMVQRTQALYVAQAGLEDAVRWLYSMRSCSLLSSPFNWYDAQPGRVLDCGLVLTYNGLSVGQYDAQINTVTAVDQYTRDIAVTAIGYVPAKGTPQTVSRVISAVVRVSVGRSHVFDYVYFINNWGWYFGDTIVANGNVRANGQFDGGNYRATVNGMPRFQTLSNGHFSGYLDDGGLYSWWNIVNAASMQGTVNAVWTQADCTAGHCTQSEVGQNKGIHSWVDNTNPAPSTNGQIQMPNLTDLTVYESLAQAQGSYIKIGGTTIVNAVQGSVAGTPQNLYLNGTTAAPIVIHGPVVVRGSVIISGVVQGQGCIYSGGNVYIANNLTYVNPPAAPISSPTQAQMESWLSTNATRDALGLFARKHVVIGDYTNSSWQSNVSSWVTDSRNQSAEDAGMDQIPNTKAGRDGTSGTSDDDVCEGDGVFETQTYTTLHQTEGLIPTGKKVGDPIPGTGEDTDGDGQYTPQTAMSDFTIPATLTSTNWAGNVPTGTPAYNKVASCNINYVNAAIYTNHQIAMLTTASGDLTFNGCVVSRNEDIIYGTNHCIFNYDYRLLDPSGTYGLYLPTVWNPVQIMYWNAQ